MKLLEQHMKKHFALIFLVLSHMAVAQEEDRAARRLKYTSPADQAIYRYEDEAEQLATVDIFKELERLDAAQTAKIAANGNWLDVDPKAMAFASVLEARRKKGQPDGAFYFAAYKWKYCAMLQRQSSKPVSDLAPSCWGETMEAFKVASTAGSGDASFNIGRQFENGYGVILSKFAAADWYIKAAEQYNVAKDRDHSLTAVEAALAAVPDHSKALMLKNFMLK